MGGRWSQATTFLYLVLKSNDLHHLKNWLKKFGFSLKITSTNISKKLSEQSLIKSVFFRIFSFSHKWPTFAFTLEIEYTLDSLIKIAHSGLHAETRGFTLVQPCRAFDRPSSGRRTAGGSGCTPTACVRFLRRRSPAGLRGLFCFCRNRCLYALCGTFFAQGEGRDHPPRLAPRIVGSHEHGDQNGSRPFSLAKSGTHSALR